MSSKDALASVAIDVGYWNILHHRHRLGECEAVLSTDERSRAGRLAFPFLRERFTLGRGLLRFALAPLVGVDPSELRFREGVHGKPELVAEAAPQVPSFSLSRSYDGLLIAVAPSGAVGCDLELVRVVPEAQAMVRQWFAPNEREALSRVSDAAFDRTFLAAWVRKEAALKAVGTGLQGSLAIETGPPRPGSPAARVAIRAEEVWLVDIDAGVEWVGAIAADRPFEIGFTDHG